MKVDKEKRGGHWRLWRPHKLVSGGYTPINRSTSADSLLNDEVRHTSTKQTNRSPICFRSEKKEWIRPRALFASSRGKV
ncbi:unnamed protein product [Soboliphyme baturini]|uniref:Uncharacterized protein n=1 Tax=Soboliphyme baturini TaxID=241478 RepID=A0A183ICU6_9BILA|nr:unnamed protein product [Soboliphyme baturini]